MFIILYTIFIILLLILIVRFSSFFKLNTLSKNQLTGLFLLKCAGGLLYLYLNKIFVTNGDVESFLNDSLIIYNELLDGNIGAYLKLTLGLNNTTPSSDISLAVKKMGFWWNTSSYIIVRLNALFNIISFGISWINSVFFAFLSFLSCVILSKIFEQFLSSKSSLTSLAIFLFPSLWYWTSGIHKECVSVLLISLILFFFLKLLHRQNSIVCFFSFIVSCIVFYFLKSILFMLLLLPLCFYTVWFLYKKNQFILLPILITSATLLFSILIPLVKPRYNYVNLVLSRKKLFEALKHGNSSIELGDYNSSFWGLLVNIPQAIFNTLFRPTALELKNIWYIFTFAENLVVLLLLISALFCLLKQRKIRTLIYTFLIFSLTYLILIGWIVPNIGAIIRYRSSAFFILIPSLIYIINIYLSSLKKIKNYKKRS